MEERHAVWYQGYRFSIMPDPPLQAWTSFDVPQSFEKSFIESPKEFFKNKNFCIASWI